MALYRPTIWGGTSTGPTADFTGSPTSGDYPLTVDFSDQSTGGPTSWDWTFGDGGTSTAQNPSHTYSAAGTYTVSLTVANADGSDMLERSNYINVTEPGTGGDEMHVDAMTVGRRTTGVNVSGTCEVVVVDDAGQGVGDATVTVSYDGPTSGTLSGTTVTGGTVNFNSGKKKSPSGEWCFEVTNITHASLSYNSGANVVTRSCESGNVYRNGAPLAKTFGLRSQPNPFNPVTKVEFNLERKSMVSVEIFDARGVLVAILQDDLMGAGLHSVTWDANDQASGIYFCRLKVGLEIETSKMVLLR